MKRACLSISILMILSLLPAGCSREKPSSKPVQKAVVKEPISIPVEKETAVQPRPNGSPSPIPNAENPGENSSPVIQEKGFYIAKGVESLATIAAKKDVYGDPLKWILLYRYNRSAFDQMIKDESFPDRLVPTGARLKLVPPSGIKKSSNSGNHWVVNVLSFPQQEKIVRDAVALVDSGYHVYIIKANVKGIDYLRLRVGFFNEKAAAEEMGQKITALLNISDIWTTKPDEAEFKEFGGYE
jgi:hypothetical protein